MSIADLKKQLEKEYPYRIEMHAHTTPQSTCGELLPEEVIELYHKKGYDGVVITNHFMGYVNYGEYLTGDYMKGETKQDKLDLYLSAYERANEKAKKCGMKAYLGIEIRFANVNNNDYLIYGADRETVDLCYDYLEGTLEEFRKNVKLDKSVFVQAHPFRNGIELVNPELLDGVETFNVHPGHNNNVGFACRYAKENNLKIKTAGSDFHHKDKNHEAVSALRTKVLPKDSFELAEILKSGDYLFEIGEDSIVMP